MSSVTLLILTSNFLTSALGALMTLVDLVMMLLICFSITGIELSSSYKKYTMSCKHLLIHHGEQYIIITGPFKFEATPLCKTRRPFSQRSIGRSPTGPADGVYQYSEVQVNKFGYVLGVPVRWLWGPCMVRGEGRKANVKGGG